MHNTYFILYVSTFFSRNDYTYYRKHRAACMSLQSAVVKNSIDLTVLSYYNSKMYEKNVQREMH